jgi:hypothetical protein
MEAVVGDSEAVVDDGEIVLESSTIGQIAVLVTVCATVNSSVRYETSWEQVEGGM